jgi:hypothetical protein
MPLPAVGCADAAFVQRRRNGDHAYRASRLNAPDNGQEIGCEPIGLCRLNAPSRRDTKKAYVKPDCRNERLRTVMAGRTRTPFLNSRVVGSSPTTFHNTLVVGSSPTSSTTQSPATGQFQPAQLAHSATGVAVGRRIRGDLGGAVLLDSAADFRSVRNWCP